MTRNSRCLPTKTFADHGRSKNRSQSSKKHQATATSDGGISGIVVSSLLWCCHSPSLFERFDPQLADTERTSRIAYWMVSSFVITSMFVIFQLISDLRSSTLLHFFTLPSLIELMPTGKVSIDPTWGSSKASRWKPLQEVALAANELYYSTIDSASTLDAVQHSNSEQNISNVLQTNVEC